ncbi:NUDIX hydrolase [Rhizobium sp.]
MSDDGLSYKSLHSGRPDQCGALCWRVTGSGVEVLLVTTKTSGRWILPKGNVKRHETMHECARREAFEEAGVTGRIGKKALGRIEYLKRSLGRRLSVSIFQMLVTAQEDDYPERKFRRRAWFGFAEAAERIEEADLRALLLSSLEQDRLPTARPGSQIIG